MSARSLFPAALFTVVLAACGTTNVSPSAPASDAGIGSGGGGNPGGGADAGFGGGGFGADAGGVADGGRGGGADAGSGSGGRADGGAGGADGGAGGKADGGSAGARALTSGEGATHLAIDTTNVYWTVDHPGATLDKSFFEVKTAPKAGGKPLLLGTVPGVAAFVSVDAQAVYFLRYSCGNPCTAAGGSIQRVPKAGGAPPTPVVDGVGGLNFASDDSELFYGSIPPPADGGTATPSIQAVSKATLATRTVVAGERPDVLAVDATTLYWSTASTSTSASGESSLRFAGKTGGAANDLARVSDALVALKVDFANVYARGRDVYKVAKAAPTPVRLAASSRPRVADIDANGAAVYWNATDGLFRVNADGSGQARLDAAGKDYEGVRVDDATAFFLRDGDVWRTAK